MHIQHAGKKDAYLLIRLPGLIFHSVRDTCPIAIKNKGLPLCSFPGQFHLSYLFQVKNFALSGL